MVFKANTESSSSFRFFVLNNMGLAQTINQSHSACKYLVHIDRFFSRALKKPNLISNSVLICRVFADFALILEVQFVAREYYGDAWPVDLRQTIFQLDGAILGEQMLKVFQIKTMKLFEAAKKGEHTPVGRAQKSEQT